MNTTHPKPRLQAIFFDFDGVIVDSAKIKTEAFRILFRDYPLDISSQIIEYHLLHAGISRVDKIRYAHDKIIGKPLKEQELEIWATKFSDLVFNQVLGARYIAGAKEFLENVPPGIEIFVISGTPQDELRAIIEGRNMTRYFTDVLGSPTEKTVHIRELLREYQLKSDQSVFVGDAMTDYNAAWETGLFFIGIQGENSFPVGTPVLSDCVNLRQEINERFVF